MDQPASPKPGPARRSRWAAPAVLLLLVSATAGGYWWWRSRPSPPQPEPTAATDDPRLTFPTRFRNVRPDVQYVGDQACDECHETQCRTYRQHPMGRSMAALPGPRSADHLGPDGRATFEALGLRYDAELRGGRLFHRETVPAPSSEAGAFVEAEPRFVIGSGTRGAGYLIAEDGYVFQSPISWYPQKGVWDLSPGYHQRNEHFDRPVIGSCLFCHANRVEPVPDTLNRFEAPVFRGEAIGCERCHGPGELHVRRQKERRAGSNDDTIVNPRRLEPALREAVCEQCHLQGQARVQRRGRGLFDYRPGLPLHLFWSVFVRPPEQVHDTKAVGQVEQMHLSRCFRGSNGALGCATCHDPHWLPDAGEKVEYYRNKCLSCHRDRAPCSLPAEARRANGDACAACHMPRLSVTDVVHVAGTDHRVPRRPGDEPPDRRDRRPGDDLPLVAFHYEQKTAEERETGRDLGVALMDLAAQAPPGAEAAAGHFGRVALPLLEAATRADPDDLPACEALGYAWRCRGRGEEALEVYESALARAPGRELALAEAATVAGRLGRPGDAARYWRRAIDVSPRRWNYHYQLAESLVRLGRAADALPECEAALRLNPASVEVRRLQVGCLVESGRKDEARVAFARLMALRPANAEELRKWFTNLVP
jgi:Flp pilus assembly protein TadD